MNSQELKNRTQRFAIEIIRFIELLPRTRTIDVIGKQLLRSATSIGANYRAACKARSKADFISKITIVEEESDETQYWLELIAKSGENNKHEIEPLMNEAKELTAIFTAAGKTAKRNR